MLMATDMCVALYVRQGMGMDGRNDVAMSMGVT